MSKSDGETGSMRMSLPKSGGLFSPPGTSSTSRHPHIRHIRRDHSMESSSSGHFTLHESTAGLYDNIPMMPMYSAQPVSPGAETPGSGIFRSQLLSAGDLSGGEGGDFPPPPPPIPASLLEPGGDGGTLETKRRVKRNSKTKSIQIPKMHFL